MKSFRSRMLGNPRVTISLGWLVLILFVSLFAPLLAAGSPFAIVGQPFLPPGGDFLLGTDSLGRDVMAGLIHGARTTLLIAVLSTLAAVVFGTLVGALAGYYGGLVDDILMRLTEFFQTIPWFLFAIVLVAILSPSLLTISPSVAWVLSCWKP